jgi:hypothetical protein
MDGGVIVSLPAWRLFKYWELLIGLVLKLHYKSRSYISNLLSNFLQVNHSLNSGLIGDARQFCRGESVVVASYYINTRPFY